MSALGIGCRAVAVALAILAFSGLARADDALSSTRHAITALAFDVESGSVIKASDDGLFRGDKGGRAWRRIDLPLDSSPRQVSAVAVSAGTQPILYVAARDFGVARSMDDGRSWVPINEGLPSRDVATLATHAAQRDTVYAYIAGRGIFRSEDAGSHWRLMDAGPREAIVQLVHSDMPGSMQTGWLFAATAKGVGRSMDCFCGWRDAGALGKATRAVAYDPKEPKRIYASTGDAFFVSEDGGEHWSPMHAPSGDITALLGTRDGLLYGGAKSGDVFVSADHGATWRHAG